MLITGTGAARPTAEEAVYRPFLIEQSDKGDGASAMSGGGLWIPDTPHMSPPAPPTSAATWRTTGPTEIRAPTPASGRSAKCPSYPTALYPSDLGTKGGLSTSERARVLREDGSPVPGLYTAGSTTASVLGRTCPGPGSAISPATTFACLAMRHTATTPRR
ncbi:FAD-binding protein [Streptomyces sp. NBC_00075]|uniref:FAD-binding protein n=1 Tax=Streptomyces sp. NBC_00075 TaxID=2975641 RepID=UPI003254CAE8